MRHSTLTGPFARISIITAAVLTALPAIAFQPKEPRDQLDLLVYVDPQLRVVETTADADDLGESLPYMDQINAFRGAYGAQWSFTIDLRRGIPTLAAGGAIPLIPGGANDLQWEDFVNGCRHNSCLPVAVVEPLARAFLSRWAALFGVEDGELVLDHRGSGPLGASVYLLRFQWSPGGVPVEHGSVFFRINNGNLIHVATELVAARRLDVEPTLTREAAEAVLTAYLGPFGDEGDRILDNGSLHVVPVTPAGQDPDSFEGPLGSGIDYRLGYRFSFAREGVVGTWEAVVDADGGDILRFVDSNRYGRIHGGAYPRDGHTDEADRPFPFADTGLPPPNEFADAGGLFPGDNATTTLQGKYAKLFDSCGAISNTTTTGDVDFSLGPGTDCAVPPANTGGAGNTHSSRTQYYHLTTGNLRAQAWLPGNTWLRNSFITVYTNQSPWCNATSGGDTLNFYRAASGCWNLGEIPGVALHEWGHSLDNFDGSGGQSRPVETYADWMAALHLHDPCVGRGFYLSGFCGGYGDPCTECSGIRDMDYTLHVGNTPWTAANYGTLWFNSGSGYYGPCGIGAHAEAGIGTQALWDFVVRKLAAPPYSMDQRTAWLLADRLWYHGIGSLAYNMYNCTVPDSDGCNGGSLYNVMMAIDDDGDGVANGTPHAAAIFSALDDHNIACGLATDPQNQDQSTCPTLAAASLSGQGLNNQAELSWTAVANATRYWVFRSDIDCDAGLLRVGEVSAPTTAFIDATVVNDIVYYYMVQAVTDTDSCSGPVSNCVTVTPVPCTTPDPPTDLTAAAAGANRIDLSWTSSDPAAGSFNVYRAIGSCPQSDYQMIATGITGTSYQDTAASGGITYAYVVSAKDVTGGCESAASDCAEAQTIGVCLEPPAFEGLQSVDNVVGLTCTLELGWNAGVEYCGGPVTYNVYRETTPTFMPNVGNRIASGITGTSYSNSTGIEFGTDYYYIVRAVDESNGAEEGNMVVLSGSPTGPPIFDTWTDDAGDTGTATFDPTPPWSIHQSGGHAGPKVYATGTYTGDLCVAVTTPEIMLGDGSTLTFWSKYDIEADWDKGEVQISTDGGTNWERLPLAYPGTANNAIDQCGFPAGNYFTGTDLTYDDYLASLASWPNETVMIRWVLSSDSFIEASGWWVDDISISNAQTPSECTPGLSPIVFADGFESGDASAWSLTVD